MNWQPIKTQWHWLVSLSLVLIAIEVINLLSGRALGYFGVIPRRLDYLPMILTSPFVHGSPQHVIANLLTLWIFVPLMGFQGRSRFIAISLFIIVLTGLLVWMFGRSAIHLGASGLIYGYFGFLLLAGWRSKRKRMLFISLLTLIVYGSMIVGIIPRSGFISWESHLFGFISGLLAAWYWAK